VLFFASVVNHVQDLSFHVPTLNLNEGSFAQESADLACITQTIKRMDIEEFSRACFIMLVVLELVDVNDRKVSY
jgi:hypothetical protein